MRRGRRRPATRGRGLDRLRGAPRLRAVGGTVRPTARGPRLRRRGGERPGRTGAPLTGRALVLGLVLIALALTLAYPLRQFFAQRAQIADARQQVRSQAQRVVALEAARDRWRDPAYVRAQARERLHLVLPGETQYVVLEPRETPASSRPALGATPPATAGAIGRPWFSQLWRSVQAADRRGSDAGPADRPAARR